MNDAFGEPNLSSQPELSEAQKLEMLSSSELSEIQSKINSIVSEIQEQRYGLGKIPPEELITHFLIDDNNKVSMISIGALLKNKSNPELDQKTLDLMWQHVTSQKNQISKNFKSLKEQVPHSEEKKLAKPHNKHKPPDNQTKTSQTTNS